MTLAHLTLIIDYIHNKSIDQHNKLKADPNVTTGRKVQHKTREDFLS